MSARSRLRLRVPKGRFGPPKTINVTSNWVGSGSGPYTKGAGWNPLGYSGGASEVSKTYQVSFTVTQISAGAAAQMRVWRLDPTAAFNQAMTTFALVAGGTYSINVPIVATTATVATVWIDEELFAGAINPIIIRQVR